MPGYEQLDPCPFGDSEGPGDPAQAAELIDEADAGGARVIVYTDADDDHQRAGRYYVGLLDKIGLRARLKVTGADAYRRILEAPPARRPQAAVATWWPEYPHPTRLGDLVGAWPGGVGATALTEALALTDEAEDSEEIAQAWAAVDRAAVEGAYAVPFGAETRSPFLSERMEFEN